MVLELLGFFSVICYSFINVINLRLDFFVILDDIIVALLDFVLNARNLTFPRWVIIVVFRSDDIDVLAFHNLIKSDDMKIVRIQLGSLNDCIHVSFLNDPGVGIPQYRD